MGPSANPRIYRLRPNLAVSSPMPKSSAKFPSAGLNPDAPHDTLRSMGVMAAMSSHFRQGDQLRGFSGEPGGKCVRSLPSEAECNCGADVEVRSGDDSVGLDMGSEVRG